MFIFPIEPSGHYQNWAFRERFLTPQECDRLVSLVPGSALRDVVLRADEALPTAADVRRCRLAGLAWVKEIEWLVQRLAAAVTECNKALYNYQLTGITENLLVEQYSTNHFHDWVQDFGAKEQSARKLGAIVQLTDPSQYEGGDVEFFSPRGPQKAPRARGTIIIYPSFVFHRVTPVTSGNRTAISGWVSGVPFK